MTDNNKITNKTMNEELSYILLKNKYYDMIYTQSLSYPFHLNIKEKRAHFFGPIFEEFKLTPVIENYPQPVIEKGVLHEEDYDTFSEIVERMYRGLNPLSTNIFRGKTDDGGVRWYTAEYSVIRDEAGEPIEVIGQFVNIEKQIKMEELVHKDQLTGCINKSSFEKVVEEVLQSSGQEEKHILFIIDLDDFKIINDNLGHLFGDLVLRETGEKLRGIFRSNDCVGRIGGDEFMVLMKNVQEIGVVEDRLKKILNALDNKYKGNHQTYQTTASIGLSIFPNHGESFEELYERADIALYNTKVKGKNGATCYDISMAEGTMSNTTPFDAATRAMSQFFDRKIILDIFGLLSEAKDYDASVNKVLEMLGKRFNADRCYVFERHEEYSGFMDNTYEWCAPGITPEIDNLHMVPEEVYSSSMKLMNQDGIFYCNDLEEFKGEAICDVMREQGIQSFLFTFNIIGNDVINMVGFDDCTSRRVWSPIEIGTLMHVSKIINQFLKYKKATYSLAQAAEQRLKVLDQLYSYAYITEPNTHELQYFNKAFQETFPMASYGDKCYKVLHNYERPCDNCPMNRMKRLGKEHFRCIMPMKCVDRMMLVDVSDIGVVDGKESMFFSCSDLDNVDVDERNG